jgi:hypothetical protein
MAATVEIHGDQPAFFTAEDNSPRSSSWKWFKVGMNSRNQRSTSRREGEFDQAGPWRAPNQQPQRVTALPFAVAPAIGSFFFLEVHSSLQIEYQLIRMFTPRCRASEAIGSSTNLSLDRAMQLHAA